jgi:hypothetical protein
MINIRELVGHGSERCLTILEVPDTAHQYEGEPEQYVTFSLHALVV